MSITRVLETLRARRERRELQQAFAVAGTVGMRDDIMFLAQRDGTRQH